MVKNLMYAKVIDCQKKNFKNRDTGELREYCIVGCVVDGAGIGFIYSDCEVELGEEIELVIRTDRNHKFTVGLAEVAR